MTKSPSIDPEFLKTLKLACNHERRLIRGTYGGDQEKQQRAARRATITVPLIAMETLLGALKGESDER